MTGSIGRGGRCLRNSRSGHFRVTGSGRIERSIPTAPRNRAARPEETLRSPPFSTMPNLANLSHVSPVQRLTLFVALTMAGSSCSKQVPQPEPPSKFAAAPVQTQSNVSTPMDDEDHPVPKPLPRPGGLKLDDEPVSVEKTLAPAKQKSCFSHEDCKLVTDNCGTQCECIAVRPSEEPMLCKDKAPCEQDPCEGHVPACAPVKGGRRVCKVGTLG